MLDQISHSDHIIFFFLISEPLTKTLGSGHALDAFIYMRFCNIWVHSLRPHQDLLHHTWFLCRALNQYGGSGGQARVRCVHHELTCDVISYANFEKSLHSFRLFREIPMRNIVPRKELLPGYMKNDFRGIKFVWRDSFIGD